MIYISLLGLDYGGVSREWVGELCRELFDPAASGLFTSFDENSQGLVSTVKVSALIFNESIHQLRICLLYETN